MHLAAHLMHVLFLADGPIKDACLSFGRRMDAAILIIKVPFSIICAALCRRCGSSSTCATRARMTSAAPWHDSPPA